MIRRKRKLHTRVCGHCGKPFDTCKSYTHCSWACKRATLDAVEPVSLAYLIQRDRGVCQLCSKPVDHSIRYPHPLAATIDHIVPLSKGGQHSRANTQLAHNLCNSKKGNGTQTFKKRPRTAAPNAEMPVVGCE